MSRYKRVCLIILVVLLLLPIMVFMLAHVYAYIEYRNIELYSVLPEEVAAFSINDYQKEIELFACDRKIDPIASLDDVVEKAQILWNKEFTVITLAGLHKPNPGDGVEVFFDEDEDCWLVRGTIPNDPLPPDVAGWLGVLPNVIICENGDVLALWQG